MLFIFSTSVFIRHLWQLKTVVFMHWCLIRVVLLVCLSPEVGATTHSINDIQNKLSVKVSSTVMLSLAFFIVMLSVDMLVSWRSWRDEILSNLFSAGFTADGIENVKGEKDDSHLLNEAAGTTGEEKQEEALSLFYQPKKLTPLVIEIVPPFLPRSLWLARPKSSTQSRHIFIPTAVFLQFLSFFIATLWKTFFLPLFCTNRVRPTLTLRLSCKET